MNREALGRGEKNMAVAAVIVCATLVGGGLWLQSINAEPEVVIPAVEKLPSPNGYNFYVQAAQTIKTWTPPVDDASDPTPPTDQKIAAQRYGLARRQAWLLANGPGFALFRRALALPCRHPNYRTETLKPPPYGKLRELARQVLARTGTYKMQGKWSAAAHSGLDTIQMGTDFPRGGGLIAKVVGSAAIATGNSSIEDTPSRLTAAEAMSAAKRLENLLRRRVGYADVLEEEKWSSIAQFLAFSRVSKWRVLYLSADAPLKKRARMFTVSKRQIVRFIEQRTTILQADIKQPYSAPPPSLESDYDPRAVYSTIGRHSRFNESWELTGLYVLLLRFALRAYTLDAGAAPHRLEQLAPRYIQTVPPDLFADGAPLHYQPLGRSYKLWSVGPDMKNDNGNLILSVSNQADGQPWRSASLLSESKGDWVVGPNL